MNFPVLASSPQKARGMLLTARRAARICSGNDKKEEPMQKPQWNSHFSCHWYLRAILGLATLLFGALGLLFLTGLGGSQSLGPSLFFLGFMVASLPILAWANRSFDTDQDGIRMRSWFGREVSLRWVDIARAESGTFNPGLHLTDYPRQTKISIDTWVSNYEQLIEQIPQARPDLWNATGTTKFRRSPWLTAIGILAALAFIGFGISGLFKSQIIAAIVLAGLGMLILYLTLRLPQQVCLESSSLRVKYFFGERIVPAKDIVNISIKVERDAQGGSGASANISLKDGKRIEFAGFNVGAPTLANTLRSWWERAITQVIEK
jgi:hypothetical protein